MYLVTRNFQHCCYNRLEASADGVVDWSEGTVLLRFIVSLVSPFIMCIAWIHILSPPSNGVPPIRTTQRQPPS